MTPMFRTALCITAALALTGGMAQAEQTLPAAEQQALILERATADASSPAPLVAATHPVYTMAALPPRRPKSLDVRRTANQRSLDSVAVPPRVPVARVANLSPKRGPLFWMTVGNGF